ncbi:MAG: hypothetical protein EBU08_00385 [Micrococcales bacterium]|nr:hypothetical protein [Micrococcales bacterium]
MKAALLKNLLDSLEDDVEILVACRDMGTGNYTFNEIGSIQIENDIYDEYGKMNLDLCAVIWPL